MRGLPDAAFGRYEFVFNNHLYFLLLDVVIFVGRSARFVGQQACAQGLHDCAARVVHCPGIRDLYIACQFSVVGKDRAP